MTAAEAAGAVIAALGRGEAVAEVVVVDSANRSVDLGERLMVWEDRVDGSLGDPAADSAVTSGARTVLEEGKPRSWSVDMSAGRVEVYVEPHFPPAELVIVGAGHIARPLCSMGAQLGYRVIVVDDRPGFATAERFPEADELISADFSDPFRGIRLGRGTHLILVTRGHKYDYDALLDLLGRDVRLAYIGMVGSQRRVRAALEQLVQEGIPREKLAPIYAPIGLDIGAETPEEIAISILAELVALKRGGTGESLRNRARVLDRWVGKNPDTDAQRPGPAHPD